jgi:hypothetical protein
VRTKLDHERLRALDLAAMTAAQIDEEWQHLYEADAYLRARVENYTDLLDKIANGERGYLSYNVAAIQEDLAKCEDALQEVHETERHFHEEWDRRDGWQRVFLVLNHDGHYHHTRACPTTYPTTRWGWVPTLSDKTEDEVIAEVGCMACTVCWPNAPRHPKFLQMEGQRAAEQKAKDEALCEGSGQQATNVRWTVSPYGGCPVCRRGVSVTKTGKARKHKTLLQEKIDEQAKDGAKVLGDAKAFNRLHTAALKVNDATDLLDADDPDRAISRAWLDERISSATKDVLKDLLDRRKKKSTRPTEVVR